MEIARRRRRLFDEVVVNKKRLYGKLFERRRDRICPKQFKIEAPTSRDMAKEILGTSDTR